ncbi:MAG: 50S ribosomal protein L18 [Gemmatimonadota bacterium]|jgi:large subunit ribosomal protein L18|nr:50S ribosomal protein L18 [Gemmatimonadota bacterium]
MRKRTNERQLRRARRRQHIRKKIRGTAARPRLVVARSLRHIEGQLVDDDGGRTIVGVSSRSKELAVAGDGGSAEGDGDGGSGVPEADGTKVRASYVAGRVLAERALSAGVREVVFDRAGHRFHGRVKAFADGARAGGLRF